MCANKATSSTSDLTTNSYESEPSLTKALPVHIVYTVRRLVADRVLHNFHHILPLFDLVSSRTASQVDLASDGLEDILYRERHSLGQGSARALAASRCA